MRAGLRWTIIAMATAIALPAALASATGTFRIDGPLDLPTGSTIDLHRPLAVYAGETQDASFVLHTSGVFVHYFEQEAIAPMGLASMKVSTHETTWRLSDVVITTHSAGDNTGLVGLNPRVGATCSLVSDTAANVTPRATSQIPENTSFFLEPSEHPSENPPENPFYSRHIDSSHLLVTVPGEVSCEGPGALKLQGLDIQIAARENITEWETGIVQESSLRQVARWFYFEFENASISLDSPEYPIVVAAQEAIVSWDGPAQFVATSGALSSPDGDYAAAHQRATLDGKFAGFLSPVLNNPASMDLASLTGELRSSAGLTHKTAKVALPMGSTASSWPLAGIAVGTVIAIGVATGLARRRVKARRQQASVPASTVPVNGATPESYYKRAEAAAEAENWSVAADLLHKAVELSDARSGKYLLDLGIAWFMQREPKIALQHFAEASPLMPHGEADVWAARSAIQAGMKDEAQQYLLRALERPLLMREVLAQIDSGDEFADSREHELVGYALAAAKARAGIPIE